jgi:BTB/POZ domain-containing adapter for CUL3-mediated RhoA degradation protein
VAELLAEAKYYCIADLIESCEMALVKREREAEPICRVPLITSQKEEQLLITSTLKVIHAIKYKTVIICSLHIILI